MNFLTKNLDRPFEPYAAKVGCRQDLPDALLLDDEVIDQLIEIFRAASPLVRYFN